MITAQCALPNAHLCVSRLFLSLAHTSLTFVQFQKINLFFFCCSAVFFKYYLFGEISSNLCDNNAACVRFGCILWLERWLRVWHIREFVADVLLLLWLPSFGGLRNDIKKKICFFIRSIVIWYFKSWMHLMTDKQLSCAANARWVSMVHQMIYGDHSTAIFLFSIKLDSQNSNEVPLDSERIEVVIKLCQRW